MNHGELDCDHETGTITFGGTPGTDPIGRWCMYDLSDLWSDQQYRGEDTVIPGVAGVDENDRRFNSTRYLLPIAFTGWINSAGVYVGQVGMVRRCYEALQAWRDLFLPGEGTAAAIAISYTDPVGQIMTTTGHLGDLRKGSFDDGIWDGDVELTITRPWSS